MIYDYDTALMKSDTKLKKPLQLLLLTDQCQQY